MRVRMRRTDASSYSLNGVDLNITNSRNDLGVKFDSALSFADHIDGIVFKAKQRANQILRCFVTINGCQLKRLLYLCGLYLNIVRLFGLRVPFVTAINKLESVQRMFTKRLPGMLSLSYNGKLPGAYSGGARGAPPKLGKVG